jgi:hypothetical protein
MEGRLKPDEAYLVKSPLFVRLASGGHDRRRHDIYVRWIPFIWDKDRPDSV